MAKYLCNTDTWISHESRMVKAGQEFETSFPSFNGKPMRLGPNLTLIDGEQDEQKEVDSEFRRPVGGPRKEA